MITQSEIQQIMGADVYGPDGEKVGSAGQVYLDNVSGEPEWVSVRTGLFGTKRTFVPITDATERDGDLAVPFEKSAVKDAPGIDANGQLSQRDELTVQTRLNNLYASLRWSQPERRWN